METPKEIVLPVENEARALTNVLLQFDEEMFQFMMVSGNQGRLYFSSPKHAKRFLLLLQTKIKEYEDKFGVLETQLNQTKPETSKAQFGF